MSLTYEEKQKEWTKVYYEMLIGLTCVGVDARTDSEGDCWPVIIFKLPEKDGGGEVEIEVSRDEEGNGPGFLFGLPPVPDNINPFLKDN
jgi:hypothetical protein